MSNGEQWDFFKRIENLEETTKGLQGIEATAEENRALLVVTFWLAFTAIFDHYPYAARTGKDEIKLALKDQVSQQLLDILEDIMLKQCETFETRGRR